MLWIAWNHHRFFFWSPSTAGQYNMADVWCVQLVSWVVSSCAHVLHKVRLGFKLFVCTYFVEMAKKSLCFSWSFRDWRVFPPKFFSLWHSFFCDIYASSDVLFQSSVCSEGAPQRKRLLQEDFLRWVSLENEILFRNVNECREALPASSI